jgi:hypothetical protein
MLDPRHRRLSTYLYLQDLLHGAAVLEVGAGDREGLTKAGAKSVELREPGALEPLMSGIFDLVIALDVSPASLSEIVKQATRLLKPEGSLVVGGLNGDRPGVEGGFSFYDLSDACQAKFAEVKMVGQAPFFAATLVEYGVADPEPVLDGRLVEKGEKVERYLAIAGPKRAGARGYGVVQLPSSELAAAPTEAVAAPTGSAPSVPDVSVRLAELEAECNKLREKEKDARAEAWKALKARSEAEAAAAEVREDTVRKLKDARKLASVELMRAMEEATKKNVSLKEELVRTERERKEFKAEVARLTAELEAIKAPIEVARAKEEGDAAVLAVRAQAEQNMHDEEIARAAAEAAERAAEERVEALRGRVLALERELAEAQRLAEAERERAARLGELVPRHENDADRARVLAELELSAKKHAEEGQRTRLLLQQREQELQAVSAELEAARSRAGELELELSRKEGAVERAAAAAGHERARAERLVADERRALSERNEARAKAAEVEARAAQLISEIEQLQARLTAEEERAHKAENEVAAKKDRVKQLKRELEEAERRLAEAHTRVAQLELVRDRLGLLEETLRGEEQRMAGLEESLRRAAEPPASPPPVPAE